MAELDHDHTEAPGAIMDALRGVHTILRDFDLARHGNDDQAESPQTMLSGHRAGLWQDVVWLVAMAGPIPREARTGRHGLPCLGTTYPVTVGDVVAAARLVLPLLDNRESMQDISLQVRSDWQRRGVGRRLSAAIDSVARARGRNVLSGWIDTDASAAPDALRPSDGELAIAPSPGTAFATAMGYRLAQAERHSVQQLADYQFEMSQVPQGYRLVSWVGVTPSEHLDQVAELQRLMSTDIPMAELVCEEEVWDAARVIEADRTVAESSEMLTTMAIYEAGDAPAGFTQLNRMRDKPAAVYQWNTLVTAVHRGHGLGMVLKQANLVRLAELWPDAERVHTWNAAENDYMWTINQRLGYRTANIDSGWQKRLD